MALQARLSELEAQLWIMGLSKVLSGSQAKVVAVERPNVATANSPDNNKGPHCTTNCLPPSAIHPLGEKSTLLIVDRFVLRHQRPYNSLTLANVSDITVAKCNDPCVNSGTTMYLYREES